MRLGAAPRGSGAMVSRCVRNAYPVRSSRSPASPPARRTSRPGGVVCGAQRSSHVTSPWPKRITWLRPTGRSPRHPPCATTTSRLQDAAPQRGLAVLRALRNAAEHATCPGPDHPTPGMPALRPADHDLRGHAVAVGRANHVSPCMCSAYPRRARMAGVKDAGDGTEHLGAEHPSGLLSRSPGGCRKQRTCPITRANTASRACGCWRSCSFVLAQMPARRAPGSSARAERLPLARHEQTRGDPLSKLLDRDCQKSGQ